MTKRDNRMDNLDVTASVNAFREVISASWLSIKRIAKIDTTGSFLNDWMQANWERVVESSITPDLKVILEPYGEGADCNIKSSRVWNPEAKPNAYVNIRYIGNDILLNAIDGREIDGIMVLDHFCALKAQWPVIESPFDHVVLVRDDPVAIPARDLKYYVRIGH